VGDSASQHCGQFCFSFRLEEQSRVDELEAPRQSKRIYYVRIDHSDGNRYARIGILGDYLSDAIYVFGDDGIVE
jgi:hypothetical protein